MFLLHELQDIFAPLAFEAPNLPINSKINYSTSFTYLSDRIFESLVYILRYYEESTFCSYRFTDRPGCL